MKKITKKIKLMLVAFFIATNISLVATTLTVYAEEIQTEPTIQTFGSTVIVQTLSAVSQPILNTSGKEIGMFTRYNKVAITIVDGVVVDTYYFAEEVYKFY